MEKQAGDYFTEVGLVIDPETEIEDYSSLSIAVLQVMGVVPGSSGQPLLVGVPERVSKIKEVLAGTVIISVDGGVNEENIRELQKAGASRFIISSHIFITQSVAQNFQHFMNLVTLGGTT